jgi:hypothetical protein
VVEFNIGPFLSEYLYPDSTPTKAFGVIIHQLAKIQTPAVQHPFLDLMPKHSLFVLALLPLGRVLDDTIII